MNETIFLIVDLFCGACGTTTGFAQAEIDGNSIAKVIACVNHDPKAIKSHWQNHPDVKHFEEDIRTLDLTELIKTVNWWKERYPDGGIVLDPFMGAGTTALVARKLGRNYVGIELNPQYVKIAEDRLKKQLGMFQ